MKNNNKRIFDEDLEDAMQFPHVRKVTERLHSRLESKEKRKEKAMKGTVAELKKMLNAMNDQDLVVAPFGREKDQVAQAVPTIIEVLVFGKKRSFGEELLEWNGDPREYGYADMKALQADGGKIIKAIVLR
jgi:hypothetical protein